MTSAFYLDLLDETLRAGLAGRSGSFINAQVRFVTRCRQEDGGFRGRQGDSDLYYTDFAVRTLSLLAPGHDALDAAAAYVARRISASPPVTVAECFNALNVLRITKGLVKPPPRRPAPRRPPERPVGNALCGVPGPAERDGARSLQNAVAGGLPSLEPYRRSALLRQLQSHRLPQGGYRRLPADRQVSAYHTFLAALCYQMLGEPPPGVEESIRAIRALRRPDGGYAELAGQSASQTSATAAAVGLLMLCDSLLPAEAADTAQFLAAMQAPDGGLKAHGSLEHGDLLSTFTGLVTLRGLATAEGDSPIFADHGFAAVPGKSGQSPDVRRVAAFLRSVAHPQGGMFACPGDDSPDVEYTYWGVALLGLLSIRSNRRT